jgi:pantoate--beta-alanine ligase
MKIARTKAELRQQTAGTSRPRVLVPTMGALHAGHLALIGRAREAAGERGSVVVSIFVNPIQFDRAGDLESYPRPLEDDLAACRSAGADLVFVPEAADMYAPDRSVVVAERSLSRGLCGATRPGHFDGVCTVVLKLFHLTACDAAVFGEKDFQQLAVVRRMVRDLDLAVEILAHPTLREPDGLAMSSRNVRLTPEQRADAPLLRQALAAAAAHPEKSAAAITDAAASVLQRSRHARIDYLELVDPETLQPVTRVTSPAVLAAAVFFGGVRLIDHLTVAP